MDFDIFVIHIKIENVCEDIANDVGKWFDTSNYKGGDKRPLPRGMNKKNMVFLRMN